MKDITTNLTLIGVGKLGRDTVTTYLMFTLRSLFRGLSIDRQPVLGPNCLVALLISQAV